MMRLAIASALVCAMSSYGVAYAQPEDGDDGGMMDDEMGDEGMGDDGGTEPEPAGDDDDGGGDAGGDAGSAEAAAPGGKMLEIGGHFLFNGGLNGDAEFATASNDELNLWAGLSGVGPEQLKLGLDLRLALIKPDLGATLGEISVLQGIQVHGGWKLDNGVTPHASLGTAPAGMMFRSMWGSPVLPFSPADSKLGGTLGAGYDKKMDKIMLNAGANLVWQLDSDTNDMGEQKMGLGFNIQAMALYQVSPGKISAGGALGIHSGPGFETDANEGFHVPLEILGMYHLSKETWVGAHLGFSSLTAPDAMDAGGNEWGIGNALNFGVAAQHTLSL